eukprot:63736-Pyramimonas_sp.AAC.1
MGELNLRVIRWLHKALLVNSTVSVSSLVGEVTHQGHTSSTSGGATHQSDGVAVASATLLPRCSA